jgi:hypothetical protein
LYEIVVDPSKYVLRTYFWFHKDAAVQAKAQPNANDGKNNKILLGLPDEEDPVDDLLERFMVVAAL